MAQRHRRPPKKSRMRTLKVKVMPILCLGVRVMVQEYLLSEKIVGAEVYKSALIRVSRVWLEIRNNNAPIYTFFVLPAIEFRPVTARFLSVFMPKKRAERTHLTQSTTSRIPRRYFWRTSWRRVPGWPPRGNTIGTCISTQKKITLKNFKFWYQLN